MFLSFIALLHSEVIKIFVISSYWGEESGESNRAGPGEAQMTGKVELLTAPGQAETLCDMMGVLSHSQLMRYFN